MGNTTIKTLQLGIEAARAGQKETAKTYLKQVLEQDPHNLPALFWLAFVASSPQKSISLLERVLAIDPENERAKAGIQWAKKRLTPNTTTTSPQKEASRPAQAAEEPPELPDEFIRQQLLSKKDVQKQAKKGALAHRARRKIDPLLTVAIILSAAAMLTLGTWLVALTPAETLAAWLPVSANNKGSASTQSVAFMPMPENTSTIPAEAPVESAKTLSSANDTLILKASRSVESIEAVSKISTPPEALAPFPELNELITPAQESNQPVSPVEDASVPAIHEIQADTQPLDFIGPAEDVLSGPRLFVPVAEELLAHKPAFPDEKWIEVNVTEQRVTAWEGNVPVMSFLSSTGLPGTPTVLGEFNIYWKLESTLMTGPGYYLPEVPHTMYFYAGYALHGAYWHDNFGNPMSHGCVNLGLDNAKKLFEWADPVLPAGQTQVVSTYNNPGTLVVVHE